METQDTVPQSSGSRCHRPGHSGARFGRGVFFLLVALAAGFVGGYAGRSFAHGSSGLMSETMDPTQMDEHIERMVKHLAVEVDATPEQKDKLTAIAKSAAHDLAPLRGKVKSAHQQAIDLLSAEKVDRSAIENLRAEQIALADATTKRLTLALADAADVLTVEQRKKIAERVQRFGHRLHHG